MLIIGISGKAGVGKDEFAKVAEETASFTVRSFAAGVKMVATKNLRYRGIPYTHEQFWGDYKQKEAPLYYQAEDGTPLIGEGGLPFFQNMRHGEAFTPRAYMQWVGDYGRSIAPFYWINRLFKSATEPLLIISDVRQKNEAQAVKERGGLLVRIERPLNGREISNPDHPSETELDTYTEWDYTLVNDGSLEEFRQKAGVLIREILERKSGTY